MDRGRTRHFTSRAPIDLRLSLSPMQRGANDRTMQIANDGIWRATNTPEGPSTVRITGSDCSFTVRAWGDGADWSLDQAERLLGIGDRPEDFVPNHPLLHETQRRHKGLRLCATNRVVEALVPTILEQKVQAAAAYRSYRQMCDAWGEPAPGPAPLRTPPTPQTLAAQPSWAFHQFDVERKRAEAIRLACRNAARLEAAASMTPAEAQTRLTVLPGLGPWTANEVTAVAMADPDAVSVGDYHLPNQVTWALANEARGDDARMLELLEPFAGHRARAVRLILLSGKRAPKFGPKLPYVSIRNY